MPQNQTEIQQFTAQVRAFVEARDWEQYNSPKNLAMALTGEVGELVEHFQWLTQAQSRDLPSEKRDEVGLELADCFIYLLRLSDTLGVDLIATAKRKLQINEARYPVDVVRGKAIKRPQLDTD